MLDSLDTLIAFVLIMLVVSLLITIAVQMVSAALNLRGLNLFKGLSQVFRVVTPALGDQAGKLARAVLEGSLLSDSSFKHWPAVWRLATAVRADEVFDSLYRLATGKKPAHVQVQQSAQKLLVALGVPAETFTSIDQAGTGALGNIDGAYEKFEYWYELSQERVQQWFTTHARILTVIFAFIFAFWLQLDTVAIFKLVSSDRTVRDKLVAQAGAVEAQAAKYLGDDGNVLRDALKAWSAKQTDPALRSLLAGIQVGDTDSRDTVRDRVITASGVKKPVDTFDAMVTATASQRLKEQAGSFNTVKSDLDKTGFDLIPKDDRGRWGANWKDGLAEHFWGMLFSVALLSLGAPFWYNSLKNLTSLRSTVAQNIAGEKDQAQQRPPVVIAPLAVAPPATQAPPTVR